MKNHVRLALLCGCGAAAVVVAFGYPRMIGLPNEKKIAPDSFDQIDPHNPCGLVCVSVVSRLLDRPSNPAQSRKIVTCDALGRTSMAELVDGLGALGFAAFGARLDQIALKKLDGMPIILHTRGNHFVVILPMRDGTAVFFDPPHPVRTTTRSELSQFWDGDAIIVQSDASQLSKQLKRIGIETQ
jgi:ABC-type bacteriocin/lantibiotic exporter with double-glycine peptidase domain